MGVRYWEHRINQPSCSNRGGVQNCLESLTLSTTLESQCFRTHSEENTEAKLVLIKLLRLADCSLPECVVVGHQKGWQVSGTQHGTLLVANPDCSLGSRCGPKSSSVPFGACWSHHPECLRNQAREIFGSWPRPGLWRVLDKLPVEYPVSFFT